jgi:HAD superfamily hydrolase (TIGR01549 family)
VSAAETGAADRWICLDVGETLIDETRLWSIWADELRVPLMTFMSAFGAAVARGREHHDVFTVLGVPDWRERMPAVQQRYGGFQPVDLYPDALPSLDRLRGLGYRIAITANQPVERTAELRALGVSAEVMAMSDELGVWKPDPAFFARTLELLGSPDPARVAYVGDRIDNDVRPSIAAGMRSAWLRRGPWGVIGEDPPAETALVVDSLSELADRAGELFPVSVESQSA